MMFALVHRRSQHALRGQGPAAGIRMLAVAALAPIVVTLAPTVVAHAAAPPAEPPVKLSTSGVCHERGTPFYSKTTNFTPFRTLDACLRAGGRLPEGVRPLSGVGAAPASPAELVALGAAWTEAEARQDRPALERLLDERFRATLSNGRTIDRRAYVASVIEKSAEPFRVSNEFVEVHGDTGLVIAKSAGGANKLTWVAVRREGQWHVISLTFTTVASAAR